MSDRIISETTFLNCENLPKEMAAALDRPWNFCGMVDWEVPDMGCLCIRCSKPSWELVVMRGHRFITDDMISVMVYFGTCDRCHDVYWAHSGPPFRRVMSAVPVGT